MNRVSLRIKLFALNIIILFMIHNNLMSMKRTSEDLLLANNNMIAGETKKYSNYFSPERKKQLVGHMLTGDKLFDAGFLQAYVASSIDKTITPVEQATYLLHKTFKYALYTCKKFNSLTNLSKHNNVISMGLHKIYGQLQWFERGKNIIKYTPHMSSYLSVSLSVLTDFSNERRFEHGDHQGIIDEEKFKEHYNSMPDGNDDALMNNHIKNMNNELNPLIYLFQSADVSNEELATIQICFNKIGQTVLLPVLSKSGIIGLGTFNYFLSLGYVLVGFGRKLSCVHSRRYLTLSDVIYHDFLHIFLWIYSNRDSFNLKNDLLLREAFLEKIHTLYLELINQYHKTDAKQKIEQYITFMFFILHEQAHPYTFYSPVPKKISLESLINHFFSIKECKLLDDTECVSDETLDPYLFSSIDLYFILRCFIPEIDQLMKQKNLQIDQFTLIKTDDIALTGKDLKNFISPIAYYMIEVGKNFLHDYKDRFENTFPYE